MKETRPGNAGSQPVQRKKPDKATEQAIDAAAIVAPVAAASGRGQKCYKTRWAGKNFHFHFGIYLKIDAAAIVAPVAAASGRAQKCYKTGGAGKTFNSTMEFT